jgi:hypothetical protein
LDANYPDAYAALGMLRAMTGHGAEAVKSVQKAVTLEPASAQAHLNLGLRWSIGSTALVDLRSFLKPLDWMQSWPPLITIWADSSSRQASTKTRTGNCKP